MNAAVLTVARSELRRRWLALLVLGLIAGVTGAAVTGAAATARRTGTADERLARASAPGDAIISSFARPELGLGQRVADLPVVERAWTAGFSVTALNAEFVAYLGVIAGPQRPDDLFQPVVVSGRDADPADPHEVVAFEGFARAAGVEIGDVLDTKFLAPEEISMFDEGFGEPDGPNVELHVVGIARTSLHDDAIAPIMATPAFAARYGPSVFAGDLVVAELEGGVAAAPELENSLEALSDEVEMAEGTEEFAAFEPMFPARSLAGADSTSTALVGGLAMFAAIAGLAGLMALWQSFSRHHTLRAGDQRVEAALGLDRKARAMARVVPAGVAALAAAAITAAGGLAAGAIEPMGGMRRYEPAPGFAPNLGLIALGALAAALAVLAVTAATALLAGRRANSTVRVSAFAERIGTAGASPPAVVGVRFALEPGRGRSAVPMRSALVGATIAVAGVLAALTFAGSSDRLVGDPERWGWDGHFVVSDAQPGDVGRLLGDDRISSVAVVASSFAPVDGRQVSTYSVEPRRGSIEWTLLDGRLPANSDDVVFGAKLAADLGVGVGDVVDVGRGDRSRSLEVIGVGLGPTSSGEPMGLHMLMTTEGQESVSVNRPFTEAVAELKPGEDVSAVVDEYAADLEVAGLERPREIENLRQLGLLPEALAGFLAVVGVIAIANGLVLAVRRRARDIAVLRTFGFVPRQAGAAVVITALTVGLVALIVGSPLGLAAGTVVWRTIAGGIHVATDARIPVLAIVAIVPAALLVAVAIAAGPARRAARLRPAELLRAE